MNMGGIPHLDLEVSLKSEAELKSGALQVLKRVRPGWDQTKILWRTFTDGITNKLVGGWLETKKEDTVLVRVYGEGTEKIIDRQAEVNNMLKVQSIGCGSQLYATFNNGLCYEFIQGEILSQAMLEDPLVYGEVARTMARMHSVPLDDLEPGLWDRMDKFISLANPACRPRLVTEFPTKDQMRAEMAELRKMMDSCSSPVVFSHNDALLGNIVVKRGEERVKVSLIDMEYGGANYAAYDIANHFVEFVGCEGQLDYERWFPSRAYQRDWVKEYLGDREGAEEMVETTLDSVEKFVLASHLLWSAWAVIQAENSSIDFDFEDYAIQRIVEYRRWKKCLLEKI